MCASLRLLALARRSRDADQTRRLLALASIYNGGSRTAAAKMGNVGLQIVRDWVLAFNARGPAGLIDGKAPGSSCPAATHRPCSCTLMKSPPK